ncbi:MAG: hypothetical protein DYG91_10055 [Chloroflexi bacterium CFX7]|nr:hypothetical protein [Chloroflexi bacterium CFX7]
MVALDEHGSLVAFGNGGSEDHGRDLGRFLECVAHLRARKLEDGDSAIGRLDGTKESARHVVGHTADVDGGRGEAGHLATASRGV